MAHQTSKIPQKQSTPHSIGRLMDADFPRAINESGVAAACSFSLSHDGRYIYFDTTLSEDPAFFRVRISDHKLERLLSLNELPRYWGPFGTWTGLAPDDSLLLDRDISSQEIYALDWQAS